jgi:hypothetical protein
VKKKSQVFAPGHATLVKWQKNAETRGQLWSLDVRLSKLARPQVSEAFLGPC